MFGKADGRDKAEPEASGVYGVTQRDTRNIWQVPRYYQASQELETEQSAGGGRELTKLIGECE